MDLDKLNAAMTLVNDLYAKGHGKDVTVRRMIDVLGFTDQEAEDLFNRCAYATNEAFVVTTDDLPDADCPNCYYRDLEHDGAHCYMFEHKPGDQCAQFKPKRSSV